MNLKNQRAFVPIRSIEFTYLRGLDGLLPTAEDTGNASKTTPANPAENPAAVVDSFKLETDTKTLERPIGQGQFDYLRRISEQLRQIDDKLRKATCRQTKGDRSPRQRRV